MTQTQMQSLNTSPEYEHFEGPEKKLEVFFGQTADDRGFLQFPEHAWADLLKDAQCTILHRMSSAHGDAYLLSESSLFVFPHRVILKTCGTTTLLLAIPKVPTAPQLPPPPFPHSPTPPGL